MQRRQTALWSILLLSLALTIWTATREESVNTDIDIDVINGAGTSQRPSVNHRVRPATTTQAVQNDEQLMLAIQQWPTRLIVANDAQDIFAAHSWEVLPPVIKQKEVVAPPVAPQAPFTYVGKLEDSPQGTQVFLMFNQQLMTAVVGKAINQAWRLDSEDANNLYLTYLPLALPQTLSKRVRVVAPSTEVQVNF